MRITSSGSASVIYRWSTKSTYNRRRSRIKTSFFHSCLIYPWTKLENFIRVVQLISFEKAFQIKGRDRNHKTLLQEVSERASSLLFRHPILSRSSIAPIFLLETCRNVFLDPRALKRKVDPVAVVKSVPDQGDLEKDSKNYFQRNAVRSLTLRFLIFLYRLSSNEIRVRRCEKIPWSRSPKKKSRSRSRSKKRSATPKRSDSVRCNEFRLTNGWFLCNHHHAFLMSSVVSEYFALSEDTQAG